MSELKPCPFCGGEAELKHIHAEYANAPTLDQWNIMHRCDIVKNVFLGSDFGKEQVIKAWNRRANDAD